MFSGTCKFVVEEQTRRQIIVTLTEMNTKDLHPTGYEFNKPMFMWTSAKTLPI